MNMEAKLQELYGDQVIKLDNGTYYVLMENGHELFIPETISQNQSMIAYAPGSGGSRNDAIPFRNMCKGENPPNCVVAIAPGCTDNGNVLNVGTDAINNLGGSVGNVVYASFSASGIKGLEKGEEYLKANPDVSMSIISCDGCGTYSGLKDYPTIKETETPFVIIAGSKRYLDSHNKLTEAGYNNYYLKVNNGNKVGHTQLNKDMINYILLYALGELDEIPENDIQYELYKETFGQLVDFENMQCEGGTIAGYDKNKFKSVLKLKNLGFTGLENYKATDQIGNGYVKADFEFISASLNQIRKTISKANIATKTPSLPIQGAGGLASAISNCIDKYSAMTVNLYTKLAQETEATASYAQSIINTDLEQKNNAGNLNDAITLGTTGATGALLNNTGSTTTTPSTQTPQYTGSTGATTTPSTSTSTTTGNTGTTTPSTSTGSTGNSNSSTTPSPGSTGTSNSSGSTTPTQTPNTTPTTTNPVINGNDMTWNYENGHNLTLTVENGVVKAMKFTYNYNSVDELNKNINNILAGQIDKQYIDTMTIVDKIVEVTIKPDFFNALSLDKIKDLFFTGGAK